MNISTRKTRVSMPYRDPSNGEVYFVPADVEVQIIRNYLTHRRVEAAMESVPNLAVEAYEPTLSEFVAALQPGSAAAQERPADAALRQAVWIVARKSDGEAMAVYAVEQDAVEDVARRHRRHRDRYKVEAWQVLQPSPEPDAPRSGTVGE